MRRFLIVTLCLLSGCGTGKSGQNADYGGALVLLAYGLIGSGISRSSGGCYAICTGLTVCNGENGLCEVNPCGRGCGSGQRCDLGLPVPRCVDDGTGDLVKQPPPPEPLPDFVIP